MTENYDTETMRAIIAEARRQGFADQTIAQQLNLSPAEIALLADDGLRDDDPQLAGLVRMVEDAKAKRAAYGPGWLLRPKLSPTFNLATMAAALGVLGVIEFVENYFWATGCFGLPATSLNLPRKFTDACTRHAIETRHRDGRSGQGAKLH